MSKTRLLLAGTGGYGRSVVESDQLSGQFEVVGFLGDSLPAGKALQGVILLAPLSSMAFHRAPTDQAILAIGNNVVREKLMQQKDAVSFERATYCDTLSTVSPSPVLGTSSAVMADAIVGNEARLGVAPFLNCGAVVDHHATVEDFRHLGVNASMVGCTLLRCGAWIQVAAYLEYGEKLAVGEILSPETGRERCQIS
jgi:hypothetical protein